LLLGRRRLTPRSSLCRWKRYLPFQLAMLGDVEAALDQHRARVGATPSKKPTSGWLRRKVNKIAKSAGVKLSRTARKEAKAKLRKLIEKGGNACGRAHKSWTGPFVSAAGCVWAVRFPVLLIVHT
jgi:hypothetical protein